MQDTRTAITTLLGRYGSYRAVAEALGQLGYKADISTLHRWHKQNVRGRTPAVAAILNLAEFKGLIKINVALVMESIFSLPVRFMAEENKRRHEAIQIELIEKKGGRELWQAVQSGEAHISIASNPPADFLVDRRTTRVASMGKGRLLGISTTLEHLRIKDAVIVVPEASTIDQLVRALHGDIFRPFVDENMQEREVPRHEPEFIWCSPETITKDLPRNRDIVIIGWPDWAMKCRRRLIAEGKDRWFELDVDKATKLDYSGYVPYSNPEIIVNLDKTEPRVIRLFLDQLAGVINNPDDMLTAIEQRNWFKEKFGDTLAGDNIEAGLRKLSLSGYIRPLLDIWNEEVLKLIPSRSTETTEIAQ